MKLLLLTCCLLCLTGCGKGERQHARRRVAYPAMTASPPPPLAMRSDLPEASEPLETQPLSNTHSGGSWIENLIHKENVIKSLKEEAIKADPDDPFALSEEDIEALSKIDNLEIY